MENDLRLVSLIQLPSLENWTKKLEYIHGAICPILMTF